jgi:coenzyme F420-reducing hydrogenase alpha subunit
MQTTLSTKTVLATLITNRDKHQKDHEKALKNFFKQAQEALKEQLELAKKSDKKLNLALNYKYELHLPDSHVDDYDRVIKMIGSSSSETVLLNEQDYTKYIEDDWDWKKTWTAKNSKYM